MMNQIAKKAQTLGLSITAAALADTKITPDAAPHEARLCEPAANEVKLILSQMVRRGGDAPLVEALWANLSSRPLERALVAVDLLAHTLWSPQDPRLDELQAAAATLGAACPPAGEHGVNLNLYPARDLIEQYAGSKMERTSARSERGPLRSTVKLLALAYNFDLMALNQLLNNDDDLLKRRATQDSIFAFAQLAVLARLPTLASVYLDWLVRGVGWPTPAMALCETLFDAGVAHKIPGTIMQLADLPRGQAQHDIAEYLRYRSHISVGDTDTAQTHMLDQMAQRARWLDPPLRIEVVRAHLGILYGLDHTSLARVELACQENPRWRYGAQVRTIMAAKHAPHRALELFLAYLSSFGNDFASADILIALIPSQVKLDVARIVCREAFYLPHEPAPWKLLGLLQGVGAAIATEIDARLVSQSTYQPH